MAVDKSKLYYFYAPADGYYNLHSNIPADVVAQEVTHVPASEAERDSKLAELGVNGVPGYPSVYFWRPEHRETTESRTYEFPEVWYAYGVYTLENKDVTWTTVKASIQTILDSDTPI